jgi:superoxide dismutase, Fe-Mn family
MDFKLKPLPYAQEALEPHISAATLHVHHEGHHKTYLEKLQKLIEGTPLESLPLIDVLLQTKDKSIRENAAQAWNHDFYWQSMMPDGGGKPTGALLTAITRSFGSFDQFSEKFTEEAAEHFGSGWVWLIAKGDKVEVITTHDGDTPVKHHQMPLLTCDLWEHAYYLDYKNNRPQYIAAFLNNVASWKFASDNFRVGKSQKPEVRA